jgi:hypothetical protein
MMDRAARFVVVAEAFLASKQLECIWLDDCAPQACLEAKRAVALGCALTQINIRFIANATAVAAA